ncbi:MAG TPA: hypothetical protein VGC80_07815 [Acetobacteraceae bacterium]
MLPLVRLADPGMTPRRWTDYAEQMLDASLRLPDCPHGMVVVKDEAGELHGFFAYNATPTLTAPRTLSIEPFVVASTTVRPTAMEALLLAVRHLLRELECEALQMHGPVDMPGPVIESLARAEAWLGEARIQPVMRLTWPDPA